MPRGGAHLPPPTESPAHPTQGPPHKHPEHAEALLPRPCRQPGVPRQRPPGVAGVLASRHHMEGLPAMGARRWARGEMKPGRRAGVGPRGVSPGLGDCPVALGPGRGVRQLRLPFRHSPHPHSSCGARAPSTRTSEGVLPCQNVNSSWTRDTRYGGTGTPPSKACCSPWGPGQRQPPSAAWGHSWGERAPDARSSQESDWGSLASALTHPGAGRAEPSLGQAVLLPRACGSSDPAPSRTQPHWPRAMCCPLVLVCELTGWGWGCVAEPHSS